MTENLGKVIRVGVDVREDRAKYAASFRQRMTQAGTLVVRLMSSPGSGKTSLLQRTAEMLSSDYRLAVLVGDIETQRDAIRLAPYAPTFQITTGGACHLELPLVERGLQQLPVGPLDFLFVEDIGNLICPASHDLGEHVRVVLLSTTEGDDKPGKYPKAFRLSHVMVITKTDLLAHVPFEIAAAEADARRIRSDLNCMRVSALKREGLEAWVEFLIREREHQVLSGKSERMPVVRQPSE